MGDARILDPMAVLSDGDIRRYLAKGELRIEPFDEANLTPNGYDVTIEEVLVPSSNVRTSRGVAKVPPMTRFAVSTRESVGLGRHVVGPPGRSGGVRDDRCGLLRHPHLRRVERRFRGPRGADRRTVRPDRLPVVGVAFIRDLCETLGDVPRPARRDPRTTVTSNATCCCVGEYARTVWSRRSVTSNPACATMARMRSAAARSSARSKIR